MKIKKFTLAFTAAFAVLVLFTVSEVQSNKDYPRAGNSGDSFTNKTCAQNGCHPSPSNNPAQGDLDISIGLTQVTTDTLTNPGNNFVYTPGTQYFLNLTINTLGPKFGFQACFLDATGNKAGNLPATLFNPATTTIRTSPATGTRQYIGHLNSSANKTWTFVWTAPATNIGDVTLYYAYNVADNNDDESGDVIYNGSIVMQPFGVGINDPSVFGTFGLNPNPVNDNFNLSFNLDKAANVTATLVSIDGKVVSELMSEQVGQGAFNRSFNVDNMPAGVYLVRVSDGKNFITQKLLKQ